MSDEAGPSWDELLRSAARLQELVPDAVLVGGTAASLHAGHRVSFDHDHVVRGLIERYDDVLRALEETDGWVTARERRPVMILGSLDGVESGVRNLIRVRPLEVQEVVLAGGRLLRVPTIEETLRIKAWLVVKRNATRDHLDVAALASHLGASSAARVLAHIDEYYENPAAPADGTVALQLARQLAQPLPFDLDEVDLTRYRRLDARWQRWSSVATVLAELAAAVLDALPSDSGEGAHDAPPSP